MFGLLLPRDSGRTSAPGLRAVSGAAHPAHEDSAVVHVEIGLSSCQSESIEHRVFSSPYRKLEKF